MPSDLMRSDGARRNRPNGFSLVECLLVVALLGIAKVARIPSSASATRHSNKLKPLGRVILDQPEQIRSLGIVGLQGAMPQPRWGEQLTPLERDGSVRVRQLDGEPEAIP